VLARSHAGTCGPVWLTPTRSDLTRIATITLCLINQQRAAHGLPALRSNRALQLAARSHSRDMVARRYFSHDTPEGVSPWQRMGSSGYGRACTLGENIAAGSGRLGTPAAIVGAWIQSPGHRANILSGSYRDTGLGVAYGYPAAGVAGGATYTQDFGARC
jgi:uncharacterized protein YkwD